MAVVAVVAMQKKSNSIHNGIECSITGVKNLILISKTVFVLFKKTLVAFLLIKSLFTYLHHRKLSMAAFLDIDVDFKNIIP